MGIYSPNVYSRGFVPFPSKESENIGKSQQPVTLVYHSNPMTEIIASDVFFFFFFLDICNFC